MICSLSIPSSDRWRSEAMWLAQSMVLAGMNPRLSITVWHPLPYDFARRFGSISTMWIYLPAAETTSNTASGRYVVGPQYCVVATSQTYRHIFKVKSYNGRNHFFIPFIVRIPYYIWVGCSRKRDTSRFVHAFEIEGGNLLGNCSPVHRPTVPVPMASLPDLDLGPAALGDLQNANLKEKSAVIVNVTPPLRYIQGMPSSNSSGSSQSPAHSSFHYQLKHVGYQSCSTQHI